MIYYMNHYIIINIIIITIKLGKPVLGLAILTLRTWPMETIQIFSMLLGRPKKGWQEQPQEILVPSQVIIRCLPSCPWYVEWNHQWYCHSQWPQEGMGTTVSLVFKFWASKEGFLISPGTQCIPLPSTSLPVMGLVAKKKGISTFICVFYLDSFIIYWALRVKLEKIL